MAGYPSECTPSDQTPGKGPISDPTATRRGGNPSAWGDTSQHENAAGPASQEGASQRHGTRGFHDGLYSPSSTGVNDPQDGGRGGSEVGGPRGNPDPHPPGYSNAPLGTFSGSDNK
jgi:hypothetical protein